MNKLISLNIETLSDEGYGISIENNNKYLIKNTLPSEIVEINPQKNSKYFIPNKINNISPYRNKQKCKHFLFCGGCQLQHLDKKYYTDFKTQKIKKILDNLQFPIPKKFHYIDIAEFTRRKVIININYNNKPIKIGFFQEFSKQVIDIEECVIINKEIFQIILKIKNELINIICLLEIYQIAITLTDSGFDLMIYHKKNLNLLSFNKLKEFSHQEKINRIISNFNNQVSLIIENLPVEIYGENYKIKLPLQYFLQATKECENILKEKLHSYIQDSKHILDLYSGFGTYSMLLANDANVKSYEISMDMVQTLNSAVKLFPRKFSLIAQQQDLEKSPLSLPELNKFDYVIINPPRQGAMAQIKLIANSNISKIAMVSCNFLTFSRDAYYLKQANYQLEEIIIIDQFLYTSHLEILALFTKS